MAIKKSDLDSSLWVSCQELRDLAVRPKLQLEPTRQTVCAIMSLRRTAQLGR